MIRNLELRNAQNHKLGLTSAQINPLSKSVWIAPAAWGAFVCRLICQHLT